MKHTYKITGMTCNGCRSHVEKTLQEVEGVRNASVDLEKGEAVVEMKQHIPWDILETALQKGGGNYHILAPGTAEGESNFAKVPRDDDSEKDGDSTVQDENFSKVGKETGAESNFAKVPHDDNSEKDG